MKEKHYTIKQRRNPETPQKLANKSNLPVAVFDTDRGCVDFRTVLNSERFQNRDNVHFVIDPVYKAKKEAKSSLLDDRYFVLTDKGRFDICNIIRKSSGYIVLYMKYDEKKKEWFKESEYVPDHRIVKITQLN